MSKTFDLLPTLPRLPVLNLQATVTKYLKTIEPFCASQEEYEKHKALVMDFANTVGPTLQAGLLERVRADGLLRDKKEAYSWLERWWNDYAYFEYRDSLLINVTYGMTYEDSSVPATQLQRASVLASILLGLKKDLEDETFPQDKNKEGGLCMAAYKALFHSCRIPHPTCDYTQYYNYPETNHIVVMVNNQFYSFSSLQDNGQFLTPNQILVYVLDIKFRLSPSHLTAIESASAAKYPPVGVLACQNRTIWAHARDQLLTNPVNKNTLEIIQKAAFLIVLDGGDEPKDQTEFAFRTWCGGGDITNRFYDAPLQLIIYKGGRAGIAGEHSRMDGQPVIIVSDLLLEREKNLVKNHRWQTAANTQVKPYQKLEWEISERTRNDINEAVSVVEKEISKAHLSVMCLPGSGKKLWKSFKISPDAIIQAALQLTYYQLHGSIAPTYESVSTRKFARGRTETGRSVSNEQVKFVKAMADPNSSDAERLQLFRELAKSHVNYAREAGEGRGVDRHFLGLKLIAQEKGIKHPLFSDPLFTGSCHWTLSTSTLAPKCVFGPVVEDGYGICYTFREQDLTFSVSSWNTFPTTDATKYNEQLQQNLQRMKALLSTQAKFMSKERQGTSAQKKGDGPYTNMKKTPSEANLVSLLDSLDSTKRTTPGKVSFSETHPFYGLFKLVDPATTSSSSQSQTPRALSLSSDHLSDSQSSQPLSQSARELLGRSAPQRLPSADFLHLPNPDFLAATPKKAEKLTFTPSRLLSQGPTQRYQTQTTRNTQIQLTSPIKSTAFKLTTPTQPGSKRKRAVSTPKLNPFHPNAGLPNKRQKIAQPSSFHNNRVESDSEDEVAILTRDSHLSQLLGRPRDDIRDARQELEDIDLTDSPPKSFRRSPLLAKGRRLEDIPKGSLPDDEIEESDSSEEEVRPAIARSSHSTPSVTNAIRTRVRTPSTPSEPKSASVTPLASKFLTPKKKMIEVDEDESLSIEDEQEEKAKPKEPEDDDPIDDQAGSSQPSGRRLFGFYYQEEEEEPSSDADISPPASPYKYNAPASIDLTSPPPSEAHTNMAHDFRAAISSPFAQKRQLLTSKKGTEGGAIILNKLNVDQSKNTQVSLADKEHGQLLRALQTLQMVEASASHKRPPLQLVVLRETTLVGPLSITICAILRKERHTDIPAKEDFLELVLRLPHFHLKPPGDPLKSKEEARPTAPHYHHGTVVRLPPPYHPLTLEHNPLPLYFASHVDVVTTGIDVSLHLKVYDSICWTGPPSDIRESMHFFPHTMQDFTDYAFSQLTATPVGDPNILLPHMDLVHHYADRVSIPAFVRRTYLREPAEQDVPVEHRSPAGEDPLSICMDYFTKQISQLFISNKPIDGQRAANASRCKHSSIIIESFVFSPRGEISILSEIQIPQDMLSKWEPIFAQSSIGKKYAFSNLKVISKQLKSSSSPIYGVYDSINPENHLTTQEYDPNYKPKKYFTSMPDFPDSQNTQDSAQPQSDTQLTQPTAKKPRQPSDACVHIVLQAFESSSFSEAVSTQTQTQTKQKPCLDITIHSVASLKRLSHQRRDNNVIFPRQKRFSVIGKISFVVPVLDSTQTHLDFLKVFLCTPTSADHIETLILAIPSEFHTLREHIQSALKFGTPLLFQDIAFLNNFFVVDSYSIISALSLGTAVDTYHGAQLVLNPDDNLTIPLKDCLDYNETLLELQLVFNETTQLEPRDCPSLTSLLQLDTNSIYSLPEGSCTVVQVRDKKGEKVIHFLRETDGRGDETMGQGEAVAFPLEPFSSHITETSPHALRFYILPWEQNQIATQPEPQEKVFYSHGTGKLVTTKDSLHRYNVKLLVLHNASQDHFNLCLTHDVVCKLLSPSGDYLSETDLEKLVGLRLPQLLCHVVSAPKADSGGVALLETLDL